MFSFIFKWVFRAAMLAVMAAAMHSCGAAHIYADDVACICPQLPQPTVGSPGELA